MRHRRLLLFLILVLLPGAVLLAATVRLARQERELGVQRQREARAAMALQLGQELRARLERLHAGDTAHAAAVVLVARLEDGTLVLPWETSSGAAARPSGVAELLAAGARAEFGAQRPAEAAEYYARAAAAAADPALRAEAALLRARALRAAGRPAEAVGVYRGLAAEPVTLRDREGLPLALYAADALLAAGDTAAALAPVTALAAAPAPAPVALYAARSIAANVADASPLVTRLEERLREAEEVLALRGELPSLLALAARAPGGAERVWLRYGSAPWLVGLPGSGAPRTGPLVIARGDALLDGIARETGTVSAAAAAARLTAEETGTESPGPGFAGLNVGLPSGFPAVDAGAADSLLTATLPLVLGLMLFTAYLLWRDVRREVAASALRSRFVSSVSHELKTPLTSIRMFAEMLRFGQVPAERRREYLDIVVNESERLTRLINNVLDFSRIDRGERPYERRPVVLGDVVRDAVQAMSYPLAQDGFELSVRVDDELPPVLADRDAITQAVLNLLSNALKFSGASRHIDLELARENGAAVIRVADRGPGVPADERRAIFQPYFRSPSAQAAGVPGTGLGLALVAHIARGHGGSADVADAPGGGSVFSLRIPLAAAAPAAAAALT